jgi:two-component sensor histidine kinase
VLHELATNAARHGALSVAEGSVALEWRVKEERGHKNLEIDWTEAEGPAVAAPARKGFGTSLIERGIKSELQGEASLSFMPAGLACRIEVPLSDAG